MRTAQEMMGLIIDYAMRDNRVRLVTMEGSRTNKHITRDKFQDFDISYFVMEMDSFKENDQWLSVFGNRIMMQKPEDMELFPPTLGTWFSYLMLFEDGNKLDLKLVPINEVEEYFRNNDGLVEVLLDKDSLVNHEVRASDQKYWIKKPSAREFDDCCNEFWNVATYIVKGLARREILFAVDHLNNIARPELLRVMSWKIGSEQGYSFSVGKNYKFINRYLPEDDWNDLLSTYSENTYQNMWQSLYTCYALFRQYSRGVAERLGYKYPDYDKSITKYTDEVYKSLRTLS